MRKGGRGGQDKGTVSRCSTCDCLHIFIFGDIGGNRETSSLPLTEALDWPAGEPIIVMC